jgi:hypothetical protein
MHTECIDNQCTTAKQLKLKEEYAQEKNSVYNPVAINI